jgi:myosin heavy subunit
VLLALVTSALVVCAIVAMIHDTTSRSVLLSPALWRSVAPSYIGGKEARADLSAFFDGLHERSNDWRHARHIEGSVAVARASLASAAAAVRQLKQEQSLAATKKKLADEQHLLTLEQKELSVKMQLAEATDNRDDVEEQAHLQSSSRAAVVKGKSGYKRVGKKDKTTWAVDANLLFGTKSSMLKLREDTRSTGSAKKDQEIRILEGEVETLSNEVSGEALASASKRAQHAGGVMAHTHDTHKNHPVVGKKSLVDEKKRETRILEGEVETLSNEVSDEALASARPVVGKKAAKARLGQDIFGDDVRPVA